MLNRYEVIGNLGADPEIRYTSGGTAVATVSVATTEKWRDKNSGQQKEETEWHRAVLWGRLGEIAGEFLKKGSTVFISGKIKTRKWEDKDGVTRYTSELVARELKMLSSKLPAPAANSVGGFRKPPAAETPKTDAPLSEDQWGDDDDIPF